MECGDVRDLVDCYIDEELPIRTTDELQKHLRECYLCREELAARRRVRASVQDAFQRAEWLRVRPEFVTGLTARLRARAEPRQRSGRRPWWSAALIATAATWLVAIGAGTREPLAARQFAELTRDAVGDHQNCVEKFQLQERPISLTEAGRHFGRLYSALSHVTPAAADADQDALAVVERHACVFNGRRFAHIVVRYRDVLGSVLVTNSPDGHTRRRSVQRVNGLCAVSFAESNHAVFVVCPLSAAEAQDMTDAFKEPIGRALAHF